MKKLWIILLAALLCGCAAPEYFETMLDVYEIPQLSQPRQVLLTVPEEAAAEVISDEYPGVLYFCDGYTILVQTLAAGDLDATVRTVTGYSREQLQLISRKDSDCQRYECTWVSAAESGDQVGRAVILDDGSYHYTLSVMADAENAGALSGLWQELAASFTLHTQT